MLKFDEKVVKLDLRTLENLDYQIGIVREKNNRKNIRYEKGTCGMKIGRSSVREASAFG